MELNELLNSRRSVRKYQEASISKEEIETLINSALLAPSWKNTETGRYYVICGKDKIDEFRTATMPAGNAVKCENAACLIVSSFVKNIAGFCKETGQPDNECGNEWGAYDLGLQAENILLKAKEIGYDTLVIGIRDADSIREFCSIPETEEVMAVIVVGKRAEDPQMPPRKPLERVLKYI